MGDVYILCDVMCNEFLKSLLGLWKKQNFSGTPDSGDYRVTFGLIK